MKQLCVCLTINQLHLMLLLSLSWIQCPYSHPTRNPKPPSWIHATLSSLLVHTISSSSPPFHFLFFSLSLLALGVTWLSIHHGWQPALKSAKSLLYLQGVWPEFVEEFFCLLDEQHSRSGPSSGIGSLIRPGIIVLGLLIAGPPTNALLGMCVSNSWTTRYTKWTGWRARQN